MSKKKMMLFSVFLLFLVFLVFFVRTFLYRSVVGENQAVITVGEKQITVEIAKTNDQIRQGLSGRKEIGADGMLFMLPTKNIPSFWMKDMLFPLDFIWIDGQVVVDIHENVPIPDPGVKLMDLPTYAPKVPVTKVLEVPSGFISKYDIKIGDSVK